MNRKWIYYSLTTIMGCASIGGNLNSQLILVGKNQSWSGITGWEIIFGGYGSLIYAIGCFFLASLSDKFGRLPCIAVACLIAFLANCMMGYKIFGDYQLWNFFVYWLIMNLVFAVFFTGVEGLLSDYQDHSVPLAKRLGAYCIAWCIGDVTMSVLTGNIKQITGGGEFIYIVLSFITFAAFAATILDWLMHGYKKLGSIDIGVADIRPQAKFHAKIGRTGLFFASVIYTCVVYSFPRFGRDYHLLTESNIGNLLGLLLFAALVVFIFFPRWVAWHYRADLQIILQTPIVAGLILSIMAPANSVYILGLGFVLIGIGWATSYFFSIYYSLMVIDNHAKSGGIHEAFLGLGSLIGPVAAVLMIWLIGKTEIFAEQRIAVVSIYVALFAAIISLSLQLYLIYQRDKKVKS